MKRIILKNFMIIILLVVACEDGVDGLTSLINLVAEAPGSNCVNGGYRIEIGIDRNKNGVLESNEIQETEFICNGLTGTNGYSSLINVMTEPQGANCSNGGYKIDTGLDLDRDNTLDPNEVQQTKYLCNGTNGIDGINSLVRFIPEPNGPSCTNGGYKIEVGADTNRNGMLDQTEIQQTVFVCNGENGTTINEVRLKVFGGVGSSSSTPFIHKGDLIKYDKGNYPNLDSVIFIVDAARTTDANSNIIFELYDLTNNEVIINSEVNTTSTSEIRIFSNNIFSNLPDSEIDLGLRIRSEIDGVFGDADGVYLFLYKRN